MYCAAAVVSAFKTSVGERSAFLKRKTADAAKGRKAAASTEAKGAALFRRFCADEPEDFPDDDDDYHATPPEEGEADFELGLGEIGGEDTGDDEIDEEEEDEERPRRKRQTGCKDLKVLLLAPTILSCVRTRALCMMAIEFSRSECLVFFAFFIPDVDC